MRADEVVIRSGVKQVLGQLPIKTRHLNMRPLDFLFLAVHFILRNQRFNSTYAAKHVVTTVQTREQDHYDVTYSAGGGDNFRLSLVQIGMSL